MRLLTKIESYGIKGPLKRWLEHFLTGRKQYVTINGKSSPWTEVKSGIPLGSVLGPVLFVIFINDLPAIVKSMVKIFADDTKVYRSVMEDFDRQKLQEDLDQLKAWSERWQLHFNASKCKVIHLGSKNKRYDYTMDGVTLESTDREKDLGVIIDEQLKFHIHVAEAVKKATKLLGLIKRTFSCLDIDTLPRLFTTMVRPHLEYGNLIWHPRFELDAMEIEKVQRRATKLVSCIKHLPYSERLKTLKIPSLYYRRRRVDMIQTYKIMNGIDRLDPEAFFEMPEVQSAITRGHSKKIFKKRCSTQIRQNSFSNRIVNDWCSLPEKVVSAQSLNDFKARLDSHWIEELYSVPN
jgi:ribonuclease P/MRP protein subunit RPP40